MEDTDVGVGDGCSSSSYERAARALHQADYLLILAGAGMSADSGLGTYEDMPSRYRELCDPVRLATESTRSEFQSFWKSFALNYESTTPHEGYEILDKWCHGQKLKRLSDDNNNKPPNKPPKSIEATASIHDYGDPSLAATKWWVYTSNVDGHFRSYPSFRCQTRKDGGDHDDGDDNRVYYNNVCEIHGRAQEFRCSCGMGYFDREGFPRMGEFWEHWNEGVERADVSQGCKRLVQTLGVVSEGPETASGINNTNNDDGTSDANSSKDPTIHDPLLLCHHCEPPLPLRPNVLMFNDTDENVLRPIQHHRNRYQEWEAQVEVSVCDDTTTADINFVLVEIGCGTSVPAIRHESEEVLRDTLDSLSMMNSSSSSSSNTIGSVTLIRINPREAGIDDETLMPHVIPIRETSLVALRKIDEALDSIISGDDDGNDYVETITAIPNREQYNTNQGG